MLFIALILADILLITFSYKTFTKKKVKEFMFITWKALPSLTDT